MPTLQKVFHVYIGRSVLTGVAHVVVSAPETVEDGRAYSQTVLLVAGSPGMENVRSKLRVGGRILVDTASEGVVEVRVMSISGLFKRRVECVISHIPPGPGALGGWTLDGPSNDVFAEEEKLKIAKSIESLKSAVMQLDGITPEQALMIDRKLDQLLEAATRLGRKDWLQMAIGSLVAVAAGAALTSDTAKALLRAFGDAFSWLTDVPLRLLR